MKKVRFTNKAKNESNVYLVGNVGERVFPIVNNVKETNDAIRWCNTHKVGDKFDCDAYTLEIIEG
jgi:hypothetical protein